MDSFVDLEQRLRTHLCYAHVFGDALTLPELVARCDPAAPDDIERVLAVLAADGSVERVGEHWFLRGERVGDPSHIRRTRERRAREVMDDHSRLIRLLVALPWVRMVAVSGSLGRAGSVSTPKEPVDLDLFIVTAPSAVHIVRFMLRLWGLGSGFLAGVGLLRGRSRACPNYVTEEGFLEVTNRSFYTASDSLQVRVLKGSDVYQRFLATNRWIGRYYPAGVRLEQSSERSPRRAHVRAAVNAACFGMMASYAWVNSKVRRRPFEYSIRFRFDRINSFRRSASAGGGYQPQVARRFEEIYARHFATDESLREFLFPGTTATGVYLNGTHSRSSTRGVLVPDE